jgi:serine protease Do
MAVMAGRAVAGPLVVDDVRLYATLAKELGALADAHQATDGETLAKASKSAPLGIEVNLPGDPPKATGYEDLVRGVYIIGSVGKCAKCEKWHVGSTATAWCLTPDGLMVTSHHVFAKAAGASWGVCSVDGKVFRVVDVLATNEAADVALFRVDAKDLCPLALGSEAAVGTRISIISHPDRRFFFRSSGEVARYLKAVARPGKKESTWMSVTADFAKGSSGGPVLDADGAVVGMVSSTQSIYYGPPRKDDHADTSAKDPKGNRDPGPLQMVIKNCVPVCALRAITKAPAIPAERQ